MAIKFDKLKITEKTLFLSFFTQLEYLGGLCHKSLYKMVLVIKLKITNELKGLFKNDSNLYSIIDIEG